MLWAFLASRPPFRPFQTNSLSNCSILPEVYDEHYLATNVTRLAGDNPVAQQRFLTLFLRSEREIFRYVAAMIPSVAEAEEITQQTAVALWEKFDAYDPAKPFTPWACRFALNKARQWVERRQRWQALLANGLAEELALRREALLPAMETRLAHLESCVAKLPEGERTVVRGYYYRRCGIEGLAGESGRTVEATYKMLQRIRRALRQCVESAENRAESAG
jgi:RNA polymerase sigma-70 factor (ECF subfamily)